MKYVSYREIGIKACGLVAIIAMFLPFIHVEDYYQLSVFDMFFGLEEVSVNSPEVMDICDFVIICFDYGDRCYRFK